MCEEGKTFFSKLTLRTGENNTGNKGLEGIFIVSRVKVEEKALFLHKQQKKP